MSQGAILAARVGAQMGEEVDPSRLYQIKGELDASGIYLSEEVARFCEVYFKPKQKQSLLDHQAMNVALVEIIMSSEA